MLPQTWDSSIRSRIGLFGGGGGGGGGVDGGGGGLLFSVAMPYSWLLFLVFHNDVFFLSNFGFGLVMFVLL